ncbi:MAG: hypothetical protein IPK21_22295 [Haliscomenobacter sp.]|nr:hypothetical protein [Haliscomenobacter sp.]
MDEMAGFLMLEEKRGVADMFQGGNKFSCFNIPSNQKAIAVLLGILGDSFYWGIQPIERTQNGNWFIEMGEGTVSEFVQALKEQLHQPRPYSSFLTKSLALPRSCKRLILLLILLACKPYLLNIRLFAEQFLLLALKFFLR